MAGGQKINDRSSWIGKGNNGSVFPSGTKARMESSSEGAGEVSNYEDTDASLKATQKMCKSKINSYPDKQYYR